MKKLPNIDDWDWEDCKNRRSPAVFNFLRDNWKKPVTEDEYVAFMVSRPKFKKARHSPSRARHEYRYLKSVWGFFRTPTNFL